MVHGPSDVAQDIGVPVFVVMPALKTRRARFMQFFNRLRRRKAEVRFA